MKIELKKFLNNNLPKNVVKINIEYNEPKKEISELIKYIEKYNESIFINNDYCSVTIDVKQK